MLEGLLLGLATGGISLIHHKLVDGRGDVGGQLLLLDLELLLLLNLYQLLLLLLRHNCRRWQRNHGHRIINPEAVQNVCAIHSPLNATGIKIRQEQNKNREHSLV